MTDGQERSDCSIPGPSCAARAMDGPVCVPEAGATVLSVLRHLMEEFARAGVAWCYWKSSRRLPESLAGLTDFDILVGRSSQQQARRVLLECGFRRVVPVAAHAEISVECYLNYDEPSGRIAHVDLHTRLTVGGALLKTHGLPWEASLIERARVRAGLAPPHLDAPSEAVLLVVRASLELTGWAAVTPRHRALMVKKFTLDRAFLAARVVRDAVQARAAELLGPAAAPAVVDVLFDPRPLLHLRHLQRQVRGAVACFRLCGVLESLLRSLWRGLCVAAHRLNRRALHWPRPWNSRVAGGGLIAAVIGLDGAGKSTVVRGLRAWLEGEVDVLPLYFGTGDGRPSWFLRPVKPLLGLVSRLMPRKPAGSSHGRLTHQAPGVAYSALLAVWASLVALEKCAKLRAAHRAARRGMVVLTDRFPQNESPEFNDGPLLRRLRHVPQWLGALERSVYARAAREHRPDVLIKLIASPELIMEREPTMDPALIRARTEALGWMAFGCAHITSIPASLPAQEVLRAAKRIIWQSL